MAPDPSSQTPPEQTCPPCRGTGTVISALGGTAQQVTCPWCEGAGRPTPGHDAQAARRRELGPAPTSG